MLFADNLFDVVHTHVALHQMQPQQLRKVINEVYCVLKPRGAFRLVDFHAPTNQIFWTGVSVFLLLFKTETAWESLKTDLAELLTKTGFEVGESTLYAIGFFMNCNLLILLPLHTLSVSIPNRGFHELQVARF